MGKRDYKRIPVRLEAKFTLKATDYAGSLNKHSGFGINWRKFTGVIENLSEGMEILKPSSKYKTFIKARLKQHRSYV